MPRSMARLKPVSYTYVHLVHTYALSLPVSPQVPREHETEFKSLKTFTGA